MGKAAPEAEIAETDRSSRDTVLSGKAPSTVAIFYETSDGEFSFRFPLGCVLSLTNEARYRLIFVFHSRRRSVGNVYLSSRFRTTTRTFFKQQPCLSVGDVATKRETNRPRTRDKHANRRRRRPAGVNVSNKRRCDFCRYRCFRPTSNPQLGAASTEPLPLSALSVGTFPARPSV